MYVSVLSGGGHIDRPREPSSTCLGSGLSGGSGVQRRDLYDVFNLLSSIATIGGFLLGCVVFWWQMRQQRISVERRHDDSQSLRRSVQFVQETGTEPPPVLQMQLVGQTGMDKREEPAGSNFSIDRKCEWSKHMEKHERPRDHQAPRTPDAAPHVVPHDAPHPGTVMNVLGNSSSKRISVDETELSTNVDEMLD